MMVIVTHYIFMIMALINNKAVLVCVFVFCGRTTDFDLIIYAYLTL